MNVAEVMKNLLSDMPAPLTPADRARLAAKYAAWSKSDLIDKAERAGGIRSSFLRSSRTTKQMIIDQVIEFYGTHRELN